ncbi:mucin-binding protein, partial [Limosilactobacillus reuteri]
REFNSKITVSDLAASASSTADIQDTATNNSSEVSANSTTPASGEFNSKITVSDLAASASSTADIQNKILSDQVTQQASTGFTITDPIYPTGMYKDTNISHYTFWWAQSSDGKYNLVLSTNRNGDGKIHIFLLNSSNKVLGQYTVDKNKSTEIVIKNKEFKKYSLGTVYNDGGSGTFSALHNTFKLKFNVYYPNKGNDYREYTNISFIIPKIQEQSIIYVDNNGNEIQKTVTQKGLDGQIYTTNAGKVINGYFAKEPSNSNGYISPFGKLNAKYTKDWHDGFKAIFTEINTRTGLMHVVVKYSHNWGSLYKSWKTVKEFDLAPGQSMNIPYITYGLFYEAGYINIHSIYIPQTINIRYVYKKLGYLIVDSASKAFPAAYKQIAQYPNDENHSTKAGNVTIPKVLGFTPMINGKPVKSYTFNPADYISDLSKNITIKYEADSQKSQVIFYDDTIGQEISNTREIIIGKTGETIIFNKDPNKVIKQLISKGYELYKDNFSADAKFDNDDATDQIFTVVFKHHRENVDHSHSSADGTKGTKTLTETVHYKYTDGTTAAKDQSAQVTFTRNGVLDDVTGVVTWGKWNTASQSYKDLTSPTLVGYTASEMVIKRSSNSDDEQGPTTTVIYTPDDQEAVIKYVDDENGKVLHIDKANGRTNETIKYSTTDQIKQLISKGYELYKDNFSADAKFDNDDATDQIFTVVFKHHREN